MVVRLGEARDHRRDSSVAVGLNVLCMTFAAFRKAYGGFVHYPFLCMVSIRYASVSKWLEKERGAPALRIGIG